MKNIFTTNNKDYNNNKDINMDNHICTFYNHTLHIFHISENVLFLHYQKNTYAGTSSNADASVLLQFGEVLAVSGIKYTVTSGNAIGAFTVEISTDGKNWTKVLEDTFDPGKKIQTIYFRNEKTIK